MIKHCPSDIESTFQSKIEFTATPPPSQPPHVFTIPSRFGHQTKDQLWLASSTGKGKICFACLNFQDKVYHQKMELNSI